MNLTPTLTQFFGYAALMQLINPAEAVKRGTPRPLPAALYAPAATGPIGTQVGFYRSTNQRTAAQVSGQKDPSRGVSLPGTEFVTYKGFGGKENYAIEPDQLAALEQPIPILRQAALNEITRNLKNFYARFTELRTRSIHSLFRYGAVWFDANGALQTSSSGAKYTFDPYTSAQRTANTLTKDGAGSTYNIGDWSSAGTDIGAKLRGLVASSLQGTGYRPKTIIYGSDVPGYLAANTTLQQYFARNSVVNDAVSLSNTIPQGFLDFNWVPAWEAVAGNAAQFTSNFLGIMPEINDDWYELIPCGTLVPNAGIATGQVVAAPSADGATSYGHVAYGYFNHGILSTDPYGVSVVAGDYFLPALKVATAYYFGACS